MAWARPSELNRRLKCPASSVLPQAPDVKDEESPSAKWGHEAHKWKETGFPPTPRFAKWLAEVTDDPYGLRERYWPSNGDHEVLLKLGDNGEAWAEKYSTEERRVQFMKDGWIRGIADYIGCGVVYHINDLKTGAVIDWNTGQPKPEPPPNQLPQLLIYADIWLRLYTAEPGIELSIDHWPRYPKGNKPDRVGPVYTTRKQLNEWHNEQLIPAYRLSQSPDAKYDQRPGEWCQWCRSAVWCPAVGGVLP